MSDRPVAGRPGTDTLVAVWPGTRMVRGMPLARIGVVQPEQVKLREYIHQSNSNINLKLIKYLVTLLCLGLTQRRSGVGCSWMFPMQHVVFLSSERTAGVKDGAYTSPVVGKRLFDVVFAVLLLPFVAPVIGLLWALTRRDGGPGFFAHTRVGQNGKFFKCWKLRTMLQGADDLLVAHLLRDPEAAIEWRDNFKLRDDPRITRFGRFLRRTSLDELPQIWNVLRGDMSFVGPRPVVSAELEKYDRHVWAYLAMKPGITGVWQVSGRNDIAYQDRVQMDVDYMSAASRLYDLWIIIKTLGVVFRRTGY